MNMNLKNIIIRQLLLAVYYNDKAHKGGYAKNEFYHQKEKAYLKALSIIKNIPNGDIQYKIEEGLDQNGYPSQILYFNWEEEGHEVQVSFHNPHRGLKNGGNSEIVWTGYVGSDYNLFLSLREKYFPEWEER